MYVKLIYKAHILVAALYAREVNPLVHGVRPKGNSGLGEFRTAGGREAARRNWGAKGRRPDAAGAVRVR